MKATVQRIEKRADSPKPSSGHARAENVSDLADALIRAAIGQKSDMALEKSDSRDRFTGMVKSGTGYGAAYLAAAKKVLPSWQHDMIHRQARASAGGKGKDKARVRATDAVKAELLDEADALRKRLAEIDLAVAKSAPVTVSDLDLSAILAALEAQGTRLEDEVDLPDAWLPAYQAQQLVVGMDFELAAGGMGAEQARRIASHKLADQPGFYSANSERSRLKGLDLDLGSGTAREAGYLGLDLYAYDHGTVLHDLDLGIPFDTGQVRNVRWINAPALASGPGGAQRVVDEIKRVLMVGGVCTYEGAAEVLGDAASPGLVLVEQTGASPYDDTTVIRNVYQRQALRAPSVHGADPMTLGVSEFYVGLEEQMILAALNAAPAKTAMANLLNKSVLKIEPKKAHLIKSDDHKQLVYGVVLAPHEIDSQDDYMGPAEIEKAAHDFMQVSRIVGSDHDQAIEAVPVESYIAPQNLHFDGQFGPQEVAKGSWILGVKIKDPEQWQMVLDGDYTGFSIGGTALREDPLEGILHNNMPESDL